MRLFTKKILFSIISLVLIISPLSSIASTYSSPSNIGKGNIEKIKNFNPKHEKGIMLTTSINSTEITKGKNIKSKISIKNGKFTGNIVVDTLSYNLKGELNEEAELFTGNITNMNGYTFEAYIIDENKGSIMINIFDSNGSPKSYLVDGSEAQTYSKPNSFLASTYYETLKKVTNIPGLTYEVQGPLDPDGGAIQRVRLTTKVDDAWANSSMSSYVRMSSYVSKANIQLSNSNYNAPFLYGNPASNSDTTFDVPFYFGSVVGVQVVPIQTTSTRVYGATSYTIGVNYTWDNSFTGYLQEDLGYTGTKGFVAAFYQTFNGTSMRTNTVDIYMQYTLHGKKYLESSIAYTAYPEFTVSDYYFITP